MAQKRLTDRHTRTDTRKQPRRTSSLHSSKQKCRVNIIVVAYSLVVIDGISRVVKYGSIISS